MAVPTTSKPTRSVAVGELVQPRIKIVEPFFFDNVVTFYGETKTTSKTEIQPVLGSAKINVPANSAVMCLLLYTYICTDDILQPAEGHLGFFYASNIGGTKLISDNLGTPDWQTTVLSHAYVETPWDGTSLRVFVFPAQLKSILHKAKIFYSFVNSLV